MRRTTHYRPTGDRDGSLDPTHSAPLRVVLTGFYGAGNTGDEAILSAIVGSVRETYPEAEFTVLSFDPSATTATHDVNSLYRPNIGREWLRRPLVETYRAIRQADVVCVGGGGLLQNVHNNMTVPRYLQTAVLAKLLGTPVVYYAIGAGPIDGRLVGAQIRSVCNAGDRVVVRDAESKEQLRRVGVDEEMIEVGVDAVFGLEGCGRGRADEMLREEGVDTEKTLLGVSVRHHELPVETRAAIARFLDSVATDGTEVVFVPFGEGSGVSDASVSADIARRMDGDTTAHVLGHGYAPEAVLGGIGRMDFVLGMRLHSVVMAAVAGVPVLGIPYHPKVRSVLHRLGYEERHYVRSPAAVTDETLLEAYANIDADRPELKDRTRERSAEMRWQARQQASTLDSVTPRRLGRARSALLACWFVLTTIALRLAQFRSDRRGSDA